MKPDRRGFLKLFGVSTAAVAAAPGLEPTPHVETAPLKRYAAPMPFVGDTMHVVDQPLWSRVRIERNAMVQRYTLFQAPDHSAFDWAETNMSRAGMLPAPEAFCIKKIGFVFSPRTLPALRSALIDRYALALHIGNKRFWEAPLAQVFSVGEPDREKGFTILPDSGFYELELPLIIESEHAFNLCLTGRPILPCRQITAWGVFKGLHAFGIQ